MSFLSELKRRGVLKVALAYAVVGWLFIAVTATFVSLLSLPGELETFFVVVVAIGFVIALIVSWKFEMTPSGMRRTNELSPNESIPYWSRRKYSAFIIGSSLLAGALTIFQWLHR